MASKLRFESRGQSRIGPQLKIGDNKQWTAMWCHMFDGVYYRRRRHHCCSCGYVWNSKRKQISKFAVCQMLDNMNTLVMQCAVETERERTVPKIKIFIIYGNISKMRCQCDCPFGANSMVFFWLKFFFVFAQIFMKQTIFLSIVFVFCLNSWSNARLFEYRLLAYCAQHSAYWLSSAHGDKSQWILNVTKYIAMTV